MWNENTIQELHANHSRGGVAPLRHEIARQAYVDKIRAIREAEQHAEMTGAVTNAITRLWALTRPMFTRMQTTDKPATRAGAEYPAE